MKNPGTIGRGNLAERLTAVVQPLSGHLRVQGGATVPTLQLLPQDGGGRGAPVPSLRPVPQTGDQQGTGQSGGDKSGSKSGSG